MSARTQIRCGAPTTGSCVTTYGSCVAGTMHHASLPDMAPDHATTEDAHAVPGQAVRDHRRQAHVPTDCSYRFHVRVRSKKEGRIQI